MEDSSGPWIEPRMLLIRALGDEEEPAKEPEKG